MPRLSFKRQNARRCDLIEKDLEVGLTTAEAAELAKVTAWCDAWVDARHPLPLENLDWLDRKVKELEADGREHEKSDAC